MHHISSVFFPFFLLFSSLSSLVCSPPTELSASVEGILTKVVKSLDHLDHFTITGLANRVCHLVTWVIAFHCEDLNRRLMEEHQSTVTLMWLWREQRVDQKPLHVQIICLALICSPAPKAESLSPCSWRGARPTSSTQLLGYWWAPWGGENWIGGSPRGTLTTLSPSDVASS